MLGFLPLLYFTLLFSVPLASILKLVFGLELVCYAYMMFHAQGSSKNQCSLLAVVCGKGNVSDCDWDNVKRKQVISDNEPRYPFPDLTSSGRLQVFKFILNQNFHFYVSISISISWMNEWMQVQVLSNPSSDEFQRVVQSSEPNFVYLQGQHQPEFTQQIGSLLWGDLHFSSPDALCTLFSSTLPTIVSTSFELFITFSDNHILFPFIIFLPLNWVYFSFLSFFGKQFNLLIVSLNVRVCAV